MLALGAIVFLTGVYVLVTRMREHRSTIGLLMIVYGVIMLVLGAGMIGQLFSIMMQGSTVSGHSNDTCRVGHAVQRVAND